jgi:AraC family transcriptional regulator
MKSSKTFDDVIHYLESIVSDGGDIDYREISLITGSPAALFQRIFIFVSGISISEYVRKRKLTIAGYEIRKNDISILDAAVKYGFGSHSAFTRAFKEHHGITPTEAKHGVAELNEYPRINFADMRFVGGKRVMAEMKKIIYKEADERLMVGMHRETSFAEAGKVWREFFQSGTHEKVNALSEYKCCDDIDSNDGIGLMYDFQGKDNFNLIIGDFIIPGTDIPEGLYARTVQRGLTAHIQIEGADIAEILESAYMLITEAIEKTGREIDYDNFYWCEVYTHERYGEPLSRGERVIIDYILPIKKD